MKRREFLKETALGAAVLTAAGAARLRTAEATSAPNPPASPGYKYRIAFGAWINDLRTEPLPLENWPAPIKFLVSLFQS